MANHVHWSLNFKSINKEASEKFLEIQKRVRPLKEGSYTQWFGDLFVDGEEGSPTYEESEQYNWTLDNIGPKWCYIEDMYEDSITGYSAWQHPEEGIQWLLLQLAPYDDKLVSSYTYEDEAPNFFGAATYEGAECLSQEEWDYNDLIRQCIKNNIEEIGGKYDPESGEWKDEESEDIFRDVMYETISDMQDDEIMYGLQFASNT